MGRSRYGELDEQSFLTSRVGAPEAERGGRPRRFYRVVQDAVMPALADSRKARLARWEGLEPQRDEW